MTETIEYNFLTSDPSYKKDAVYKIISETLSRMVRSGAIGMGAGWCVSMSDMVRVALKHRGIQSKLVECNLAITYHSKDPPDVAFVGFDDVLNPGEIDTHVVVVTDTTPKYLIDASIVHRLPQDTYVVIEPLLESIKRIGEKELLFTRFPQHNVSVSYREKKQKVPYQYQESIVERIETDKKIFKNLLLLKILIGVALTISTLNALRGAYDFYSVYVEENYWGPRSIQKIDERLDQLEELLQSQLQEKKKNK